MHAKTVHSHRYNWIDAIRGLAILLVINVHVIDSLYAKYPDMSPLYHEFIVFFSPFRMPVLFFLSGLMVARSISKGPKSYFLGKVNNIAYPFLAWTLICYLIYEGRELVIGAPSEIELLSALLFSPFHYLWFIYYLFFFYVITWFFRGNFLLIVLVFDLILLTFSDNLEVFRRVLSLYPFFAMGAYLGRGGLNKLTSYFLTVKTNALIAFTLMACLGFFFYLYFEPKSYSTAYSLSAILILPFFMCFFVKLKSGRLVDFLVYFGKGSIYFYLIHMPICMIYPVVLAKIISDVYWYDYIVFLFFVILICATVFYFRNRVWISILFSPKYFFVLLSSTRASHLYKFIYKFRVPRD